MIGLFQDLGLLSARQRQKMKCQIVFFSVIIENRACRTYDIHSEAYKPTAKQQFLPSVMERPDARWR